jgi:hypothetical protein
MHEERAVAANRYAGPVGCRKFRAYYAGNAKTHGAKAHRAYQRVRPLRLAETQQPIVVHADVADEDRVLWQCLVNFKGCALRKRSFPVPEADVLATLSAFEAALRSMASGNAVECVEA